MGVIEGLNVVLGDTPRPGNNPWNNVSGPYCLAAHEDDVQACSSQRATVLKGLYNDAEQSVARQAGAQYIDVFPWFCSEVCTAVIGNMVVYIDQNHISATYSTYVSGALQAALQPAMGGKRG
jgi:SGNH domain (fused to AT3 domains)